MVPRTGSQWRVANSAWRVEPAAKSPSPICCPPAARSWLLRPDEPEYVLDAGERLLRDRPRPLGAVGEHPIDMAGIGEQPLHLGRDRGDLGDREVGERRLEGRELRPAVVLEHRLARGV